MSEMRLHMARQPVTLIEKPLVQMTTHKPRGFWYGFGTSWLEWCASEQPDWIGEHWYEVTLAPEARVLSLPTVSAIARFTREYGYERYAGDVHAINWPRVCGEYDAIEINPYQWTCRLDDATSWYYSWDVASGCVWVPSLVTLREAAPPRLEMSA